jgi:hypothetical protein
MNWLHPKVVKNLGNMMDITPEDIDHRLQENQKHYLAFLKNTYAQEYKST